MSQRLLIDLDQFDEELSGAVDDILVEFGNALVNNLKREAETGATGDLKRSYQIFRTSNGRVLLGSRIGYAAAVSDGSRPHTPPFDPIQVWARRVLGDQSAAGAVWQKIKQEGTEGDGHIDRAIEQTISEFGG